MLFDLTTIDNVFVVQYFQCVNNPKAKLILLKQCGKKQAEGNRPRLRFWCLESKFCQHLFNNNIKFSPVFMIAVNFK